MKLVCSSRDDKVGIGNLMILEINSEADIKVSDETITVKDVHGDEVEIYDYLILPKSWTK